MSEDTLGRANVIIGATLDQLDKDMSDARHKIEGALAGLAKFAAGAVAAGLGALAAGLGLAIKEASEAQQAIAQLDAVLQSTGGAAGVTRDMALDLADGLSQVTRFSDDAVLGAENMLLTFTNIGSDVFPDATQAVLDMATATGGDAVGAAVQLGKALNDPINGITALTRVGVTFTDEQKAMIQSMVEAGDVAGAQALILAELQKEFGGSAEAAGKTFAGQLDRLKNSFANILESIGMAVLPALQMLADKLLTALSDPAVQAAIQNVANWLAVNLPLAIDWLITKGGELYNWIVNSVIPAFQNFWAALEPVRTLISNLFSGDTAGAGEGLLAILEKMFGPEVVAGITAVAGVFAQLGGIVAQVWTGTIQPALAAFAAQISAWWERIAPQVTAVWNSIWTTVSNVATAIATFIQQNMDTIRGIFEGIWGMIQAIFQTAWAIITGIVETALLAFQGKWGEAWDRVKLMFSQIWDGIKNFFSSWWTALSSVFLTAWAAFGNTLTTAWGSISTWFQEAWQKVTDFFNTLPATLQGIAQSIIDGFLAGLKGAWDSVVQWVEDNINALGEGIMNFFGISSPSRLMAGIGLNIGGGLALGLEQSSARIQAAAELLASVTAAHLIPWAETPVEAGGPGSRESGAVENYNLTIYSQAATEQVVADFEIMRSLSSRR